MEYVMTIPNPAPELPNTTDVTVSVEVGANFTHDEIRALINGLPVSTSETAAVRFSAIMFMSDVPDAFDNGNQTTERGLRVVLNEDGLFGTLYTDRTSGWTFAQDVGRGGTYLEQLRNAAIAQAHQAAAANAIIATGQGW
jgi:hypothetical protein